LSMSDEAPAKPADEGLPGWVMTFADLMSLLMSFFVLLLSFSEMDVSKYKEMAGSMKNAFGVQREIKVKEPPKGINVIAREFSPGRPEPTIMNVIRQMTTNDKRANLDLGKERRRPVPTPKAKNDANKDSSFKSHEKGANQADRAAGQKAGQRADLTKSGSPGGAAGEKSGNRAQKLAGKQLSQAEGLSEAQKKELAKAKALAVKRLMEKLKLEAKIAKIQRSNKSTVAVVNKSLEDLVKAKVESERRKKLEHSAKLISDALGHEIKDGSVDVETAGKKIIIRVREKASFASGRAELKNAFRPILAKVTEILKGSEGKIIVAGHTDNIPISTERFRSNWELSSARAVSVVQEMMSATNIPSNRFLVQGFADTQPMVPNDTPAHRAKNRRVEIILQQGEDKDGKTLGTVDRQGKPAKPGSQKSVALPAAPVTPQTRPGRAVVKKPFAAVKRIPRSSAKLPAVKAGKPAAVKKIRKKSSTPSSGLGIKRGGRK